MNTGVRHQHKPAGPTPRQQQVYDLIESGSTYDDVATQLGVSVSNLRKMHAAAEDIIEGALYRAAPRDYAKVDREIAEGLRCHCALTRPCFDHDEQERAA